ncbi:MAG TPA: ShlB/FhaC/HecB family hemolysin secretion/activation protein [Sphingomonadaceae bacterium]|nr:ShlB/FhaC/HecB family hemolysin secretion/activation protein [Sphingomonadaceae bacterium]
MTASLYKSRLTLLGLSAACVAAPAFAQATGQPQLPTREEVNRTAPDAVQRAPSLLTVTGGIERAPCPLADPRFAAVTVTLRDAVFDNLQAVPAEALRPAYQAYLGREMPIAVVCEIRDAAATILRRQGYLAAVQVPPQHITDGTIHFNVLMAKVVAIQVRGDAGRSERLIAGYLEALKGDAVFNERAAERYLLLARDLPGYDVRLTLRPAGTAPGEVIGEVTVIRTPIAVEANLQNYGSRAVGRFGAMVRGELYDLLGAGDRLTAGVYSTADFREQQVVQLGYDLRAGREGLTLGGRFAYAWTEPDLGAGAGARLLSRTLVAAGEASYPFLRSQAATIRGAAGLEIINQRARLAPDTGGAIPISEDRIRALYARLDVQALDRASIGTLGYSANEPRWRVGGSLELRKGLDIFNASQPGSLLLSRAGGKPGAFLARLSATADYRPAPDITVSFSPRAQYAADPLLAYEQFSGGNFTVGRGYDPGSIIGDSGAGFAAELRYGQLAPRTRDDIALQPYAFFDQAWVWNKGAAAAGRTQLSSAGAGLRAAYGDHARIELSVAAPLRRAPNQIEKGDPRILLSFSTRLLPWAR